MSNWSWWSFGVGVLVGGGQIIALEWRAARSRREWHRRMRALYPKEEPK
jgi:hypothetical protein